MAFAIIRVLICFFTSTWTKVAWVNCFTVHLVKRTGLGFMIALGAAEGLAYLHHDCKPQIIHPKVVDMPQTKSMSAVAGSYGYIAPDKTTVSHMLTVLKIALVCTCLSPADRPSMREVINVDRV
ncbi:hypothetical protein HAX54_024695 [Datura stramonium]|uniref:Protein kinase domain-containing protein n=1 Tax=Datura stramonium TaxID=4076 RepID=A0ABS8RI23_DATST|nr:hypothetical protein [Datura stramonium]